MPRYEHENFGDVQEHIFAKGIITAVDSETDTADVTVEGYQDGSEVPIFYHCSDDAEERDNGAIEGGSQAFSVDDEVIVMCEAETGRPIRIIGFVDGIKACCLFQDYFDGSYEWKDLGLVQNGFLGGYPTFCTKPMIVNEASMDGDGGEYSVELDANDMHWYPWGHDPRSDSADGVHAFRITNLGAPIPINFSGDGLWWTFELESFVALSVGNLGLGVPWDGWIYFYPFIEIVNNRNHYARLWFDMYPNMHIESEVWDYEADHDLSIYGYDGTMSYARATLVEPSIGSGNICDDIHWYFLDLDWDNDAEVFTVADGAQFWIVGMGIQTQSRINDWGAIVSINAKFSRNTICPSAPSDENIADGGTFIHFFNDPVKPYYIEAADKTWPYWSQAYEDEANMPESSIDENFTPSLIT